MDTFGLGQPGLPQDSNDAAPSNLPTTFTVPTFHQALAVDNDLTMGESIVNARVSAIENTVADELG
jgi:hypothetical protein